MLAGLVLAGTSRSSLNLDGAFKHIITDLYTFRATVIAGIVIPATGFRAGRRGHPGGVIRAVALRC
jgi:cobalt-zinc-cadmium efflux system protein